MAVLLPNMRTAIVASSFLTVTVVLGKLAIANTLLKNTFPKFLREYFPSRDKPVRRWRSSTSSA